jgi:hypothetical protein
MGATAAVGAGMSLIGGISGANQAAKSSAAQKKAITNQARIDQLNSQLQLLSLRNSRSVDELQDTLRTTAENQAYLARLGQIDLAETQQQTQLQAALGQADSERKFAAASEAEATTAALTEATSERSRTGQALTQALGASAEEQQAVLSRLQKMPEQQRAATIQSLLDVAASSGGSNEALRMLADLTDTGVVGEAEAARAAEQQSVLATSARASAAALDAQTTANEKAAVSKAGVDRLGRTFAANTSTLDAQTTAAVGDASFQTERLATTGAKAAGDLASGVERTARGANYSANEDVLKQGARISADTTSAQLNAVRSPGFFDYMAVGANAYSTYTGLGGKTNLGFLSNRRSGSSSIRTGSDYGSIPSNVG